MRAPIWTTCCAVACLAGSIASAQVQNLPKNWSDIQSDILREIKFEQTAQQDLSWGLLATSPLVQRIEKQGRLALWEEMLYQWEHPFVPITGFYCIVIHHPERGTSAAMTALVEQKRFDSFLSAPMIAHLRGIDAPIKETDRIAFSMLMGRPFHQDRKGYLLQCLDALPRQLLADWFAGPRVAVTPTANEALVVKVLLKNKETAGDMREALVARTSEYSQVPGIPRWVYLLHAPATPGPSLDAIDAGLADNALSDAEAGDIVHRYRTAIQPQRARLIDKNDRLSNMRRSLFIHILGLTQ